MIEAATTHHESPVFFSREGVDLFGILTKPTGAANGTAVLVVWGAGAFPSCGRNQIRTKLARRLATLGYHVLRMDYEGVGESAGTMAEIRFDQPWTADVLAACEWLRAAGMQRLVLVGYCFGARTVLSATPLIASLDGVVLIGPPVRDEDHVQAISRGESFSWHARRALSRKTLRNLAIPRKRRLYARFLKAGLRRFLQLSTPAGFRGRPVHEFASRRFMDPLQELTNRRTPLLLVYGTADHFWSDFQQAQLDNVGRFLVRGGPLCELKVIEASVNLQTDIALQEELLHIVYHWLEKLCSGSRKEA